MLQKAEQSTLILVDIQSKLMPKIFEGQRAVNEAIRLAKIARILGIPVIGTEQNPEGLGENVPAIKDLCDQTFIKHHFDGCQDGLASLISQDRRDVIVAGCEAHVCVLQTCIGLLDQGMRVSLASDAIGSRTPENRHAAIDRLKDAGVKIMTVEMIAFEWLRSSHHEHFKPVLELIR